MFTYRGVIHYGGAYMKTILDFINMFSSGNYTGFGKWASIGLFVTTLYMLISIVIEIMDICVLLTPNREDDKWGEKLLNWWEDISKYVKWLSIKTPIVIVLEGILYVLVVFRESLQKRVNKQREKENNNNSNKNNDAN